MRRTLEHPLLFCIMALLAGRGMCQFDDDVEVGGMGEGFPGMGMGGDDGYGGASSMGGRGDSGPKAGVVDLDYVTFDKIVGGSLPVLVRFDKKYPYGDAHNAFMALGEKSEDAGVIVATVGASDFDDTDKNHVIFSRFKLIMADAPVHLFFPGGGAAPIKYKGDKTSSESYVKFLEENGVKIVLPGCLRDFDVLATEFNEEASKWLNSAGINAVVGKAEAQAKLLSGEDAAKAKVYVQIMKKIVDKGAEYKAKEAARVWKLMGDKSVLKDKRAQFARRLNVLRSFGQDENFEK